VTIRDRASPFGRFCLAAVALAGELTAPLFALEVENLDSSRAPSWAMWARFSRSELEGTFRVPAIDN